ILYASCNGNYFLYQPSIISFNFSLGVGFMSPSSPLPTFKVLLDASVCPQVLNMVLNPNDLNLIVACWSFSPPHQSTGLFQVSTMDGSYVQLTTFKEAPGLWDVDLNPLTNIVYAVYQYNFVSGVIEVDLKTGKKRQILPKEVC